CISCQEERFASSFQARWLATRNILGQPILLSRQISILSQADVQRVRLNSAPERRRREGPGFKRRCVR
ncbi:hypothetical protein, partial [Ralstonia sp.]|uniref:hypothetical protein n=1 Tax=Ralstonia sp. TaxID=54061 RepID=UPI002C42453F